MAKRRPKTYVIYHGVAWRQKKHGMIEMAPYCPECRSPLGTCGKKQVFVCAKCHFVSDLDRKHLHAAWQSVQRLEVGHHSVVQG